MYDNSLKVPAIIKWPGVIQPGTIINKVMTSLDWYPTVVEMAGSELPENKIVRGRSLVPLLKGETLVNWDNDVYSEYSMINYSKAYMRTYRTEKWKLIKDFLNNGRDELYNLENDPGELKNLIDEDNSKINFVRKELNEKIIQKMKEVNDSLLQHINQ